VYENISKEFINKLQNDFDDKLIIVKEDLFKDNQKILELEKRKLESESKDKIDKLTQFELIEREKQLKLSV